MPLLSPEAAKLIPVAAWGLSLLCPAVPAPIWSAVLLAVDNGDVDLAAIEAFCALHGIKTYSEPKDFPSENNKGQANFS